MCLPATCTTQRLFKDRSLDKLLNQTSQRSHLTAILTDENCFVYHSSLFVITETSEKLDNIGGWSRLAQGLLGFMLYWKRQAA